MSAPNDAVDGGSVNWGRVTSGVFGSWLLALIYWQAEMVELFVQGVVDAAIGLVEYGAAILTAIFDVPNAVLDSAWDSAAAFVADLGLAALPVALVIVLVTLWLFMLFVERVRLP